MPLHLFLTTVLSVFAALLNTKDPWSTDTVILPPRSWTVIRVKFDNPSWAYLHCHMNNDM